jgi:D-alanyl-D-alanine carboxypeptidase/D-alanyl-D-alanine-endopeptidase (penicillin-binding protein 4)
VAEVPAEPAPVAEVPAEPAPVANEPAEPAPVANEPAEPAPVANEPAEPAPVAEVPAEPAPVANEPAEPEPPDSSPRPDGTGPAASEPDGGEPAPDEAEQPKTTDEPENEPGGTQPAPDAAAPATAASVDSSAAPPSKTDSADAAATTPAPVTKEPPTPRGHRGWRSWALPVALGVAAVAAAAGAVALDSDPASSAVGNTSPTTPVLSARRVPEVLAAPVARRRLAADLDGLMAFSPGSSCLVVDAPGGQLYAHNPTTPLTGASTQKLLTATGLLLALGPDAVFETRVIAGSTPSNGVVAGDLYVVGGGDAALGTTDWIDNSPGLRPKVIHDIDRLVDAIVDAGVTRVDGSIVGDGSRYDSQRYNASLPQRLIDQDQVGPIGGLMVNDGFALFSPAQTLTATVPALDPAADTARIVTDRLRARGVAVTGDARAGSAPDGAAEVATLASPPLSQVVAEMLTNSDNETAEAALKEIGLAESGEGSWAAGATALEAMLSEAGVTMDGVDIVDGTGLSIADQLTCRTLADVLALPETAPVVRDGLAVAGQTGTLAERWVGTPAAGRLRAKTGSLRNVTSLAGEVDPLAGGSLTFAYVANVPDPSTISPDDVGMPRLAEILLGYPRGIDIASLEPVAVAPPGG